MFGVLFDLDGTLVDSDPIHFEAWQRILAEVYPDRPLIDRTFFNKNISGGLNGDITKKLVPHLSEKEQQDLAERKEILFRDLAKEKLRPTKGLDKVVNFIKENRSKLKIGLATNAPRLIVDFELDLVNLDEKTFFDAAILAEEFGVGKPKPDIYIELARRLNLTRDRCVVFEDSTSGVRAAVAANIKCIGLLTSAERETLEQCGTWRTVNDFQEVDLDEIFSSISQ